MLQDSDSFILVLTVNDSLIGFLNFFTYIYFFHTGVLKWLHKILDQHFAQESQKFLNQISKFRVNKKGVQGGEHNNKIRNGRGS